MRTISGRVVLPPDAPAVEAGQVTIEVRDVSEADAPSTVVAERRLNNIALEPNGVVKFKIPVPEVEPNRTLTLRAHVSLDGSGQVKSGDLLTTTYTTVPVAGQAPEIEVPVKTI